MKKLMALMFFGAGYVLGAKAGRQRYEQIRRTFLRIKNDPRVQETAHSAADKAREQAPAMGHKIADAAGTVTDKVRHRDHEGTHSAHDGQTAGATGRFTDSPSGL